MESWVKNRFSLWSFLNIPLFHHSNIPVSHVDPIGG
jgi:hypothetical protein